VFECKGLGTDQFGSGFTFVRADIKGNIDRLDTAYRRDPQKFKNLFEIVLDEVSRGKDGWRDSDTKGLLWLKRYDLLPYKCCLGDIDCCFVLKSDYAFLISSFFSGSLSAFWGHA
jgi:Glycolipid transfer protein (GLTP)